VRGHAQDVHAAGLDLHHEEHVQAPEEHGINVQEVARQDPGGLGGEEPPPGRGCPAWRGCEPGRGQDPADRSGADAVPDAEEFALDTPVSPAPAWPATRARRSWPGRPSPVSDGRPGGAVPRPHAAVPRSPRPSRCRCGRAAPASRTTGPSAGRGGGRARVPRIEGPDQMVCTSSDTSQAERDPDNLDGNQLDGDDGGTSWTT